MLNNFHQKVLIFIICLHQVLSQNISCKFGEVKFYSKIFVNACKVDEINDIKVGSYYEGCYDSNGTNTTCSSVSGVIIRNKPIHKFPHGLNKFFWLLNFIFIEDCAIDQIHQNELMDFPHLIELSLKGNAIRKIDMDLFEYNPRLKFIDLSDNLIRTLDPKVYENLISLEIICLNKTECLKIPPRIKESEKSKDITFIAIAVSVVILICILIAGIFYYFHKKINNSNKIIQIDKGNSKESPETPTYETTPYHVNDINFENQSYFIGELQRRINANRTRNIYSLNPERNLEQITQNEYAEIQEREGKL